MNIQPDFSKVESGQKFFGSIEITKQNKKDYELFFEYTNTKNIEKYAQGKSLTQLVALATTAKRIVDHCNPIWDTWGEIDANSVATANQARQWALDNISTIKVLVTNALYCKRRYYNETKAGRVKQFLLKFFGLWNQGDTYSIRTAEDFLISHNLQPIIKINGKYVKAFCFFAPAFLTPEWVQLNLNTTHFFEYTPIRQIVLKK